VSKLEFSSLDIQETLRKLFPSWAKLSRAKNIHWLTPEMFELLMTSSHDNWKWALDNDRSVVSHRPLLIERLLGLWGEIALVRTQHTFPVKKAVSVREHVLVPVKGPQSGATVGYLIFEGVKAKTCGKFDQMVRPATKHIEFCTQFAGAKNQSYMDDLTALYNQRYLPVVFEREINRMARLKKTFSVLFMDLDFFKKVNDTRGHWIGSKLLVEVAKLIQQCTRTCDYSFRYGGDEFVVVLVDTDLENGQIVAERIRGRIEQHEFVVEGHSIKLTMSIGMAAYPQHASSTVELIKLADQAMYYGKSKSRNIVFVAG
jgi:diguanylate cyclase (GGDEF)-like protein